MKIVITAILLTLLAIFLVKCTSLGDEVVDVRYRVTVTVQTPDGDRSSSNVIELHTVKPSWDFRSGTWLTLYGEAIAVDLGDRTLFMTMGGSDVYYRKQGMISDRWHFPLTPLVEQYQRSGVLPGDGRIKQSCTGDAWICTLRRVAAIRELADISPDDYPIFVTFGNPLDPGSVALVDPHRLSMAFGPGVSLKSVVCVPTSEPITTGISKRLPWIDKFVAGNHGYPTQLLGAPETGGPPFAPIVTQLSTQYFKSVRS